MPDKQGRFRSRPFAPPCHPLAATAALPDTLMRAQVAQDASAPPSKRSYPAPEALIVVAIAGSPRPLFRSAPRQDHFPSVARSSSLQDDTGNFSGINAFIGDAHLVWVFCGYQSTHHTR